MHIDPGTAFGTGMHETTQLCIRQLKKYVNRDTSVLDVGTGSGILGITALKLGAKEVWGTDPADGSCGSPFPLSGGSGLSELRNGSAKAND